MATVDLAEESTDVGVGDTAQEAVSDALKPLGEPHASAMAEGGATNIRMLSPEIVATSVGQKPGHRAIWLMEATTRMADCSAAGLLAPAAAGDEVAFRRIVAEHHDDMRRVARYVARDAGLAEEATQAAWVIAWKRLVNVRDADSLRPWLVSVAANEAKRVVRKRRRQAEIEASGIASAESDGIDPATGIDLLDLRDALDRLGPDGRALLAMRYVAGFDSNEISSASSRGPEPPS